jgi:hypothetical protein
MNRLPYSVNGPGAQLDDVVMMCHRVFWMVKYLLTTVKFTDSINRCCCAYIQGWYFTQLTFSCYSGAISNLQGVKSFGFLWFTWRVTCSVMCHLVWWIGARGLEDHASCIFSCQIKLAGSFEMLGPGNQTIQHHFLEDSLWYSIILALPCVCILAAEAEPYSTNKKFIRHSVKESRVIF